MRTAVPAVTAARTAAATTLRRIRGGGSTPSGPLRRSRKALGRRLIRPASRRRPAASPRPCPPRTVRQ
ncbi:hypothetical protein EIO00_08760 [Thermomonospora catenispora]|nr:hypothetical protein EIO00_08760 [Thermomonospora catenispora]